MLYSIHFGKIISMKLVCSKTHKGYNILLFLTLFILSFTSCKTTEEKIFPQKEDITLSVYASGLVKSKTQYQVFSTVNGILKEILVEEGGLVKKGQVIARISDLSQKINVENARAQEDYNSIFSNTEKLDQAKKEVELARIKLENEKSLLKRQKELWADGIGSKNDLDNRILSVENAQTNFNASQLHLNDLEKQLTFLYNQSKRNTQISSATMNDYTIKSEVVGRLYNFTKNVGEMVNTVNPIATIGDSNSFIVELEIDEFDISKIALGQTVIMSMDSHKGEVYEAEVSKIEPLMKEKSRSFTIEANFIKQPSQLYPNLSIEGNIIIQIKKNTITIPRNYLIDNSYVLIGKNKVKVATGLMDYDKVEILKGISISDEISKPVK